MKKRVFVDMDNVLVDFQSGLDQQSEQTLQQYAGRLDEIPRLFGKMKPLVGAIDAVHQLNEYYDLFILSTAPWNNPSAWSDKVKWITKYLDDVFHKKMIITHCKGLLAAQEDVYLIDDRTGHGASDFGKHHVQFGIAPYKDWDCIVNYFSELSKR